MCFYVAYCKKNSINSPYNITNTMGNIRIKHKHASSSKSCTVIDFHERTFAYCVAQFYISAS